MSIQLISVSHKNADLKIRGCFALDEVQQAMYEDQIKQDPWIKECVILSTCNRMEIYLYGEKTHKRDIFTSAQNILLELIALPDSVDGAEYLRFYEGTKAIEHLFLVASGLDSMVIGEDQILGQVKDAQDRAMKTGMIGPYLSTCFRYAVTAAKKVKTDTALSKIPVSTASIAIKAARDTFGSLAGKKVMLIGAAGKIGKSIAKTLISENEVSLYITKRQHHLELEPGCWEEIPYDERYQYLNEMDMVISATSSPHYTLTYERTKGALDEDKKRLFIDMAVPQDIDYRISGISSAIYYDIDNFEKIAAENNQKKMMEATAAKDIISEYQLQFERWMVFQKNFNQITKTRQHIEAQANEHGLEKALNHFFFALRDSLQPEELEVFFSEMEKVDRMYASGD